MASLRVRLYDRWRRMIGRCHDQEARDFARYGGRGISVCERWRESFEAFLGDMGMPPEGAQIDRVYNEGNYEPGNCRWVSSRTNNRNRRCTVFVEFEGKRQSVADLAERFNVDLTAVHHRLYNGWNIERALTAPGVGPYKPRTARKIRAA